MFGTRQIYYYARCDACGSLSILDAPRPEELYPPGYYSFTALNDWGGPAMFPRRKKLALSIARSWGCLFSFRGFSLVRGLFPWVPETYDWMKAVRGWHPMMRILDVGCGNGGTLLRLRDLGFKHLEGIDPFLPHPLEYAGPVLIRNVSLEQVSGEYDLIMLHHVVEHVTDLACFFSIVRGLLSPQGRLVVRVPVCDSEAFETYGANWVQIDAPRHLTIPTRRALIKLCMNTGFSLERCMDDSSAFQFWGSEQYLKDIHLTDSRSHWEQRGSSVFTPAEMSEFQQRAERVNRMRRGDQTVFVFRPFKSVLGSVFQEGARRKLAQQCP